MPAKGYADGLAGLMNKFNLVALKEHSFVECDFESKFLPNGRGEPGCRVSLKFGIKQGSGAASDTGIRAEWAVGVNGGSYQPNRSIWAQHIQSGNRMLDKQLTAAK